MCRGIGTLVDASTVKHSWNEEIEPSASTDSGNFRLIPWKLPLTSLEANLLPPTSMEISVK